MAQGPNAACLWQVQQMELDMENQRSIMLGEVATMREDLQVRRAPARSPLVLASSQLHLCRSQPQQLLEPAGLACQGIALLMSTPCLLLNSL